VDNWVKILAVAQMWGFNEVRNLCVRELEKLSIPPVEKIHIYQGSQLDRSLLLESFESLTIRPHSLNFDEAQKLGLETTLQIARARELSRGANACTRPADVQLHGSDLRSVIRHVFGLDDGIFPDARPDPATKPSSPILGSEDVTFRSMKLNSFL
jgi:hypothetical protein